MNRKYDMVKRAAARAETRQGIIAAMVEVFSGTPYPVIRIADVAMRAGVTEQTVIRHFGGKAGLAAAAASTASEAVRALQTNEIADGPVDGVVSALCETYERFGDAMAKLFAEAHLVDGLAEIVADERRVYLTWLDRAFRPRLDPALSEEMRAIRVAQLIAVCDIATWRLLRGDGHLTRSRAVAAFSGLVKSILGNAEARPEGKGVADSNPATQT